MEAKPNVKNYKIIALLKAACSFFMLTFGVLLVFVKLYGKGTKISGYNITKDIIQYVIEIIKTHSASESVAKEIISLFIPFSLTLVGAFIAIKYIIKLIKNILDLVNSNKFVESEFNKTVYEIQNSKKLANYGKIIKKVIEIVIVVAFYLYIPKAKFIPVKLFFEVNSLVAFVIIALVLYLASFIAVEVINNLNTKQIKEQIYATETAKNENNNTEVTKEEKVEQEQVVEEKQEQPQEQQADEQPQE